MESDGDFSFKGELEGIRYEVEDDLLPHLMVDVGRLGKWRAVNHETETRFVGGRLKCTDQFLGKVSDVCGCIRRSHSTSFNLGEIEESVDEFQQPQSIVTSQLQALPLLLRKGLLCVAESVFDGPQQQSERCPELMTDVTEERGLGFIHFCKLLVRLSKFL